MQKTLSFSVDALTSGKPSGCCVLGVKNGPAWWTGYKREREQVEKRVRDAINACVTGQEPWPLTMVGVTGSGKTCAALCMCDLYGGYIASMTDFATDLANVRRGEFFRTLGHVGIEKISEPVFWQEWVAYNLAVLDDAGGTSRVSDLKYDAVKLALDKRHGMPLVITTNTIGNIKTAYDDRIWSRLAGGTVVELEQRDRRVDR